MLRGGSAKPARRLFSLEKWYIDTLLPDGTVLLVYLGRMVLAGKVLQRVTAELFCADGTRIAGSAAGGVFERAQQRLVCGPARIEGEHLCFRTAGLTGELRFVARRPPIDRAPLLTRGEHSLCWTVEVPDADVVGERQGAAPPFAVAVATAAGDASVSGDGDG